MKIVNDCLIWGGTKRTEIPRVTFTKEQAKHFRKWIKAIASGEFEQTTGRLKKSVFSSTTTALYCCLGVACELFSWEVGGYWKDEDIMEFEFVADYKTDHSGGTAEEDLEVKDSAMPTYPVAEYFGFDQANLASILAGMNDSGADFQLIARFAREVLKRATIV